MATFNYTVDTDPMARELNSVSKHVDATTGAVVAMQAAVILAEEKSANHVCANVNKGFYSLIHSQISQKIAKLQSEVDSHVMQLNQQRKLIENIRKRMERDYNMLSGRYLKLFNGLNANLKQRVFELDKPTVDFAVKEMDKVSNRAKYLTATIPVTQLESLSASQKIVASNVKHKGLSVINSMKSFLTEMQIQKKLTDQILINDGRHVKTAAMYIPVLISEHNEDASGSKSVNIALSNAELGNHNRAAIQNKVYSALDHLEWSAAGAMHPEVVSEFNKLVAASASSQRSKDMAVRMFTANKYQTL